MTATPSVSRLGKPAAPPIWQNRAFMLLWLAQAISQTAQNAIWYGMMVLVQSRSHSSTQMSLAILTLILPSVLFGVVAGAYVDRWDKRAVLIGTNAIRAVVTLGYVAFAPTPDGQELHRMGLIYAVNFVFSTVSQFFAPAEAAMIPTIVPRGQLMQANSLFHLTFTASQLIGLVLIGPLVVKLVGVDGLFIVVAVLLGLCAFFVWPLPKGPGAPDASADQAHSLDRLWSDIREVGRFIRGDREVRLAVAHWTLGSTMGIVIAMLAPGFVEHVLGIPPEDSVFILAPAGIGMVGGTWVLSRYGGGWNKHRLIEWGLAVVALALAALGLVRPVMNLVSRAPVGPFELPIESADAAVVSIVMLTAMVAGAAFVAVIVPSQTIIQERVPAAVRGRVFAVQLVLSNLLSIAPLLFLGGLADLIGVARTLMLLGAAILVVALLTVLRHRQLERAAIPGPTN